MACFLCPTGNGKKLQNEARWKNAELSVQRHLSPIPAIPLASKLIESRLSISALFPPGIVVIGRGAPEKENADFMSASS